jgi:nitroreductase
VRQNHLMDADELLTTTRTVRRRLDLTRPVPLELVRECLEIALQAPTGSNRQGWEFVVVTDQAKRAAIGELYGRSVRHYHEQNAAAGDRYAGDPERGATQARISDSSAYLGEHLGEVPVLVLFCLHAGERGSAGLPAGNQAGFWGSLLPAAWSYQLAARARGLGSAWTTLHLPFEKEIAELLGIPPRVRQGVLLPTAYFTGETFKPAHREPLETVLHVNHW